MHGPENTIRTVCIIQMYTHVIGPSNGKYVYISTFISKYLRVLNVDIYKSPQ